MKAQSSASHQTSTQPTIPDNSFTHHDQKSISKPPHHPQLAKIRELETTLLNAVMEKTELIAHQQQLRTVLAERLKIVAAIFKQTHDYQLNGLSYQSALSNHHQAEENGYPSNRDQTPKQSPFRPSKTQKKHYFSALNSPRELSEESYALSNSRTKIETRDQEINKTSAFTTRRQYEANVPQNSLKTSGIKKQRIDSYLTHSKYKNIEEIWNEADSRHSVVGDCELRTSYL